MPNGHQRVAHTDMAMEGLARDMCGTVTGSCAVGVDCVPCQWEPPTVDFPNQPLIRKMSDKLRSTVALGKSLELLYPTSDVIFPPLIETEIEARTWFDYVRQDIDRKSKKSNKY